MTLPMYKIQLHSHLDGHLRHSTIWELSRQKNMDLGYTSVEDIAQKTKPSEGTTLKNYLKEMPNFLRVLVGDRDALERVAYEAGVDQAKDGIIYSELRLFPYLLSTAHSNLKGAAGMRSTLVSPHDVIDAVLAGFRRAEAEHDIQLRLVLACFRDKPEWSENVLELVKEYKDRGVVGLDVCGVFKSQPNPRDGEEILGPDIIRTFQRAAELGVHRTAHASEAGPACNVMRVLEELKAERIGHGYTAIAESGAAYHTALRRGIHFEQCLTSSYLTGAVKKNQAHPALRLIKDKASFSINTDDPTITQITLDHEYKLLLSMGGTPYDVQQANISAIHACFLPEHEKEELLRKFKRLNSL